MGGWGEEGNWELGVGGWGEEGNWELGVRGWGEEGNWELGVRGWGEEKIGRLDDYQLSTFFSLGTRNSELTSALSSDSELRTDSALSTLHSALRNPLSTQHFTLRNPLSTQHFTLSTL
uniref:Uncharacterized protein n=1 Tax=Desertifilum tharense IPPAS B-1220 TaxID=1781255 RepID=A0ACD5GRD8_9CYAN